MSRPVEELYSQLSEISGMLQASGEISLSSSISDIYRKSLLLSAASYFEMKLAGDVQSYCDRIAGPAAPLSNLARVKAISRQYHTWFDWDKSNANKFFSMFGDGFKKHMDAKLKENDELSSQIGNFLSLGSDRNRLVHQNFGSFVLEASAEDIFLKYQSALQFVLSFKSYLDEYTAKHFSQTERKSENF